MKRKRQQIQVAVASPTMTSKRAIQEKVTNMEGTFLNEGSNGFQKNKVMTINTEQEKVTNTVGTFLNEGRDGL
ncbi:hypothetical protein [Emticicia sp. C21]|uniref:hypothetical protein n=1 Tax=Emticicia sp. C21 TaxID=2302915 RepID=UPI000E350699|nr:hypothetical protein [Emticicia sp. C21]RFS16158.1 hypothetical protein D0T08_10720 [Emticicia sp. C21]